MKVYTTDRIRNVVVLGTRRSRKDQPGGSDWHTWAGITSRMGSIAEGNTISDYDKEEIKSKVLNQYQPVVPIIWGDIKAKCAGYTGLF